MNKRLRYLALRISLALLTVLCGPALMAQENKPEMADLMRSNGKIYVVVAVCLTILIGLFIYVFSIDRKVSRLEKNKS